MQFKKNCQFFDEFYFVCFYPGRLEITVGTEDSKCCRENRFQNGGMIFNLGGWGSKYFVCNEI